MTNLNHELILDKIDDLNKINDYIPLVLLRYVGVDYFDRATDKALSEYYKRRTDLQRASDFNEYLEKDLKDWLEKHKEFEDILTDG